ncbi:helix-turn-helix domain-containing protein [Halieaceae bacterium]|nr:helix-turn-helix domain-containing protein [Halieaceae bacterium]
MSESELQLDLVAPSPGEMLRAERLARELQPRETADRLNWLPSYVEIIERDDYQSLRRPAFARGYVKAYGKLLGLDVGKLMAAFEAIEGADSAGAAAPRVAPGRPVPLQRTGLGVVVGLVVLGLLMAGLWFWQSRQQVVPENELAPASPEQTDIQQTPDALSVAMGA